MCKSVSTAALAAILLGLAATAGQAAVVVSYNFNDAVEGEFGAPPTQTSASYTAPSLLASVLSSNVTAPASRSITGPGTFQISNIPADDAENASPLGNFFQTTITVASGFELHLSSIGLRTLNAAGAQLLSVRSSADNFASVLGSFDVPTNTERDATLNLSGADRLQGEVTLRLYLSNSFGQFGRAGIAPRSDSGVLAFNGEVTAVPEPGSLALAAVTAVAALARRRKA